ncbi:MAG: peptidase S41, partial [Pelagibacterales bacterium]|nr:peptidase S41 [Pelagibacterales bacterium]
MKCLNIRKLNICAFSIIILVLFSFNVNAEEKNTNVYKQLNMFGEVYERVRREYVEEVSDKELIEAAIQGMLQS